MTPDLTFTLKRSIQIVKEQKMNNDTALAEPPLPAHVLEFIDEELKARGWTRRDLAARMGGDAARNELSLEILDLRDPNVFLGQESAAAIGRAFGTGAEIWINLENTWRAAIKERIQKHADELYIALRVIFFGYEDSCGCECDTDTCCKKIKERCAKCEARAALELVESPYAGD
jgi:plasmid maintenance system antidote protein VapI